MALIASWSSAISYCGLFKWLKFRDCVVARLGGGRGGPLTIFFRGNLRHYHSKRQEETGRDLSHPVKVVANASLLLLARLYCRKGVRAVKLLHYYFGISIISLFHYFIITVVVRRVYLIGIPHPVSHTGRVCFIQYSTVMDDSTENTDTALILL